MKTIILSCIAAAALFSFSGCDTDKGSTHSSTTTSQQTTVPAPITTTTTDTQTK
jgi:predicted small lipoprotein YifL